MGVGEHVAVDGHQFSSVAQLCPTLCDLMDYSTTGLPVHHQLPEFTQTHVHWVSDTIQPSHPLSSPPFAFNSSALSLLHGPTLTFVHDYWKNQSLDYMDTVTRGTYPNSSAQAPLWKVLLCPDILLIHWGRYHWITVPFPDPSQILPCGIQKARLFFYWLRYSKSQDRIY